MRILRIADAETAGGGSAIKTVETGKSALETVISKVFPEGDEPAPEGGAPEKKPETQKQPEGEKKPEGETVDLSQKREGDETPEQKQQREAVEAEEAKAAGMSVEDFRTAQNAEKERTDAITAKTGETLEQIYEREDKDGKLTDPEAAPAKRKTFTQDEVEGLVSRRVKKLASENEDLKRQLAEKPVVTAQTDFDQMETAAQSGLDQADDLLEQLRTAPDDVESVLRKWMGDKANNADLSVNGMRQIIRNAKRGFERQLQDAAQGRQQFKTIRQNVEKLLTEPELAKAIPFVTDSDTEEHAQFQQLRKLPQLASHPRGDYLAAALVVGMKQLSPAIKQIADRQSGKRTSQRDVPTVKLRLKSNFAGTSRPGATGKAGKMTLAQAKAKGDAGAMADAMDL